MHPWMAPGTQPQAHLQSHPPLLLDLRRQVVAVLLPGSDCRVQAVVVVGVVVGVV